VGAFDDLIPTSQPGAVLPSEPSRGFFRDLIPEKQPEPETVGPVRGFFGALERGVKQVANLPDTIALANRSGLDNSGAAAWRAHRIGQLTGESGPEVIARTQQQAAERVSRNVAELEAMPRSEAQQRLERADGWREKFSAWLKDPVELTASIAAESLPASVAGAVGGGLVGGPPGVVAGVGLSSGLMTFSSELLGNAAARGVDLRNPDALSNWLRSDAYQKDADAALTKAVTIGAIDSGTAGMAGRFVVPAIRTGLMRNVAVASAKEVGLQAGAGAGGEALGSLAAGQKIDPFNVFAEAIAEVGSGPAEVASNFRSRAKGLRSRYDYGEPTRTVRDSATQQPVTQTGGGEIQQPIVTERENGTIEFESPDAQIGQEFTRDGKQFRIYGTQEVSKGGKTIRTVSAIPTTATVQPIAPVQPTEPVIDVETVKQPVPQPEIIAQPPAPAKPEVNAPEAAIPRPTGGTDVGRGEVAVPTGRVGVEKAVKKPWQMTRGEYVGRVAQQIKNSGGADVSGTYLAVENHREYVREAIEQGKPVPLEVLKDYPDLKPKPAEPAPTTKPEPISSKVVEAATFKKGDRVVTEDYGSGVVHAVLPKRIVIKFDEGDGKPFGVAREKVKAAEAKADWRVNVNTAEQKNVVKTVKANSAQQAEAAASKLEGVEAIQKGTARKLEAETTKPQKGVADSGVASGESQGNVASSNEATTSRPTADERSDTGIQASPESDEGAEFQPGGQMRIEAMAEDLQRSDQVLRGSKDEIYRAMSDSGGQAQGNRPRRLGQARPLRSRASDFYSRPKTGGETSAPKARVFIVRTPESELPHAQRNIDLLAHGILFGTDKKVGTASVIHGLEFIQKLAANRITGLRIVFEDFKNDETRADYIPRGKGEAFDILRANLRSLAKFDLTQQEDLDLWVSSLVEELLHAATFRTSSSAELKAVWDSLTPDEQAWVRETYGKEIKRDDYLGAEYVRMVLQDRLFGHTTEMKKLRLTDAVRARLRQLVDWIKGAFGAKPQNEIARKVIDRIEGALKGEAPTDQSVFDEGAEPIGTSPDKPIAEILLHGDRDDAGEQYIPTEVFGIVDGVLGKTQYTPDQRAKSLGIAEAVFEEAGLQVTREEDGHYQLVPQEKPQNTAGRQLVDIVKREIEKYGQGSLEVTELVQSLVLDFKNGRMDNLFSLPIRNKLYSLAQGERSFRGVSLNALRGAGEDIRFIAQNIDVHLQRIWHEAYGGEQIDAVLTKIRDKFKAFFTTEVVAQVVNENPALAKVKEAQKIIKDGLDAEWANLKELQDFYRDTLIKAGTDAKEAPALAKQIVDALRPKIRLAGAQAASETEQGLVPDELTAVKGKKPIWQRIVDAVSRGEFDDAPLLREKAKQAGWKPPSDEEIARLKRLAERERQLHELSKKERDAAKGDPVKLKREQIVREESTLPSRLPLMRQMEAQWSAIQKPVNFGRGLWRNRANNAAFLNELVSANLLLRLSFAPKQAISVLSQFLVHVPTRAIAQAIALHGQTKALGQPTALGKDITNSLAGGLKAALAGYKDGVAQFIAALRGRGEVRNVDRLMSGIGAIERLSAQATQLAENGQHGAAALKFFTAFIRLGYRIAQAFDNLHGVPSEYMEMRNQAVTELMKNGVERSAANAQADNIIQSIKADYIIALQETKAFLDAQGENYNTEQLRERAHRIARRWAYEKMRSLGLQADDFIEQNRGLRETIGWNEREIGTHSVGGAVGGFASSIGKSAEKLGLPLALGRFGNAIAIGINRALHFTPMGFFPGAFGENNAWFRSEIDRNQRKVEAAVGTTLGSIAFLLALSGLFVVRLRWPRDKEERDLFEAEGHRPGTLEIPHGDGKFTAISLNTGLASFLAPYLAAGGALRETLDEREKAQEKLNAEAAKKGLPPEQIRPMSFTDLIGVAGQAGYHTVLGGRTAAGSLASVTDYGIPNVTKLVASQTSALVPGLPALQEMSRMGGVVLDSKLATFTDFLLPLPTSPARRVNFLGEPSGTPDDLQRIVQVLSGGSYPNVDPEQAKAARPYQILFSTDYRPPSIDPNKGFAIGNTFRPFNDAELERYTVLRGQEFRRELEGLPDTADSASVRRAYRSANDRALGAMGVRTKATSKKRRTGGRRLRSLRSRRSGLRSLRSLKGLRSARYSYV
jgi:hypothetical protein